MLTVENVDEEADYELLQQKVELEGRKPLRERYFGFDLHMLIEQIAVVCAIEGEELTYLPGLSRFQGQHKKKDIAGSTKRDAHFEEEK
ncbi:hypothetical protein RB195_020278 [Necator americanus]|uniref:Uncharacterized protein n=1 Tax=Necator americanus TaxID=51031 RepID=A0ABR1CJK7_NECAM